MDRWVVAAVVVATFAGWAGQAAGAEGVQAPAPEDKPAVDTTRKAPPLDPDAPVLRINGRPIGRIWYERSLAQTAAELERRADAQAHGLDNAMVRRTAMERLIEKEVLYELARKQDIPGLEQEVERRFEAFVRRVGGEAAFREQAAKQGLDEEHVRYLIRRELANAWYVENVIGRDITVTEEEARSYYEARKGDYVHPEKRKIYQILAASSRGEEAALERLEEVRRRYEAGEGFGALAREYSDEPASRLVEGFIGYRTRDELPPQVAEACFAAKPGELTDVVRTRFGYHVFLVTDVIPPENRSFEQVRDEVFEKVRQIKLRRAVQKAIKQAGRQMEVEVVLPH